MAGGKHHHCPKAYKRNCRDGYTPWGAWYCKTHQAYCVKDQWIFIAETQDCPKCKMRETTLKKTQESEKAAKEKEDAKIAKNAKNAKNAKGGKGGNDSPRRTTRNSSSPAMTKKGGRKRSPSTSPTTTKKLSTERRKKYTTGSGRVITRH